MKSKEIIVETITDKDCLSKKIRILADNKHIFPLEIIGTPLKHKIIFEYKNKEYNASYIIGSKDGKSRSGVLKLDTQLYQLLNVSCGINLKIVKISNNKYSIENNKYVG
jgi:hypothetical protein